MNRTLALMAGILFVIAVAGIAVQQALPAPGPAAQSSPSKQPKIAWSEQSVELALSRGETTTREVAFTTDLALQDVTIEPVPDIANFLSIQPATFAFVPAGQPQPIRLRISIPASATFGSYYGAIHVRDGHRSVPQTLKLDINVWQRFANPNFSISFGYPATWTLALPQHPKDTAIVITPPGDELGDAGITLTKQIGTLPDAIKELNSQLILMKHSKQAVNGLDWDVLIHRESETGVEFFTAVREFGGYIYIVSNKNYPDVVSISTQLLSTFSW